MLWFIGGAVLFVILHKGLEDLVVSGDNALRRKFLWDMGTAAVLATAVLAAFVATFISLEWRRRVGPVAMVATPIAILGIVVHAYASYLVYTRDADTRADLEDRELPVK
ncbi:MAG: hypothetical protein KF858_16955 [Candidatus Sumerlaeia bacterium]|nr:hypothetical protein [Candidatus Sumerlaeia bacterium]